MKPLFQAHYLSLMILKSEEEFDYIDYNDIIMYVFLIIL